MKYEYIDWLNFFYSIFIVGFCLTKLPSDKKLSELALIN
jgi:hypothetical protein